MIKYDTYRTFKGWEIRKTDENNKHSWLKSVYKGKYTFVSDYLYAKHYTEKTARAIVKLLNAKELEATVNKYLSL